MSLRFSNDMPPLCPLPILGSEIVPAQTRHRGTLSLVGWLTGDDLRRFAIDGYLVVPDVVPEALLGPADAEIDELIDEVAPDEGDGGPGQSAWFSERSRLPRCEEVLRRSPALEIAEDLVGPNTLDFAFDHIQVAITVAPWPHVPGGPHIDGHAPGQDPPASFTLLAGCC